MYRLDEIVKEMRERGMNVPVLPQRIVIQNGTSVMMQYFQYFIGQRGETFVDRPEYAEVGNGWRITSAKDFSFMALVVRANHSLQDW
jgi:hypothetical protein